MRGFIPERRLRFVRISHPCSKTTGPYPPETPPRDQAEQPRLYSFLSDSRWRKLEILAEVNAHGYLGADPVIMNVGPIPAIHGFMERAGTAIDHYAFVELNEAFVIQTIYCRDELGIAPEIFNVNGV